MVLVTTEQLIALSQNNILISIYAKIFSNQTEWSEKTIHQRSTLRTKKVLQYKERQLH